MATPTTQAPSAAPATPATTSEGSAPRQDATTTTGQETPGSVDDLLDGGDFGELERVLDASNDPKRPKPSLESKPSVTAEDEEEDEDEDEETQEEETETTTEGSAPHDDAPGKPLPKNFRFHTEDPQRGKFLRLMKQHPDANPGDLAKIAGYPIPAGETKTTETAPAPAATPRVDPLKGLRDEIEQIKAKRKTANENYETAEAMELSDALTEKRLELAKKERELEDHEAFQAEWKSAYADARKQAVAMYPETAKPGTKQQELVQMMVARKEITDPSFINDPSYPLQILAELQDRFPDHFPPPATAPKSRVAPALKTAPKSPSRPVGDVIPGNATANKPPSKEEAEQTIDNMSFEEMQLLADQPGVGTRHVKKSAVR